MPIRTFSMNSPEFYDAVCAPPDPWRWGPGLPKEPRARHPEVIIDGEAPAAIAAPAAADRQRLKQARRVRDPDRLLHRVGPPREVQPQPDNPRHNTNQWEPDWVPTADIEWWFGDIGYGPNKLVEEKGASTTYARIAGRIEWGESAESSDAGA